MDRTSYSIRAFEDSDYPPVAEINAIVNPHFPESAEDARRWHDVLTRVPGRILQRWVVEERASRSVVAFGGLSHSLHSYHPQKYHVDVVVLPEHRRRGIGAELYSLLERTAIERGAVSLWSDVQDDDPSSVRFQEGHGFVEKRRTWGSRLDVTHCDLSHFQDRSRALAERGIRISTLAEEGAGRPEVVRRLYDLGLGTWGDVPRMGGYTPSTFEEFLESDVRSPRFLPDANFLAVRGERFVGWSSLERVLTTPGELTISFTGTLPEFRGLGIASELKRRGVVYARAHGFHSITTNNDSLNPSIWAINEKLGFRRETTLILAEKELGLPVS
jgi:mycothiol synthase